MTDLLSISETEQGRIFWLGQGLAREHLEQVTAADVLIVPLKDARDGVTFVFHQDTASFFRYLVEHLDGKATVEVLANDNEYMELTLHGASHRFSTIVVNYVVAPLVINLLSNYLYDALKAKPSDNVEATIVIEDHECRAMGVSFKGEAKDFVLMADKVGQMSRDCMAAGHAHGHQYSANHHAAALRAAGTEHNAASTPAAIPHPAPAKVGLGSASAPDSLQVVHPPEVALQPVDDNQEGQP